MINRINVLLVGIKPIETIRIIKKAIGWFATISIQLDVSD